MKRYEIEVSHRGLNKYRVVSASSKYEAQMKADALAAQWDAQYEKQLAQEEKRRERERIKEEKLLLANDIANAVKQAEKETKEAEIEQERLSEIVKNCTFAPQLDFFHMRDNSVFSEKPPQEPNLTEIPPEPQRTDASYNPEPPLFAKVFSSRMKQFVDENDRRFSLDYENWEKEKELIEQDNARELTAYYDRKEQWQAKKRSFQQTKDEHNSYVDKLREQFIEKNPEAITEFYEWLIEEMIFPIDFDINPSLDYLAESNMLIADLFLPNKDSIPRIKSVKFIKSTQEFKETNYPESYIKKKYEDVIYQLIVFILYTVFQHNEKYGVIKSCTVNGRVRTIDKATGNEITPCILSISVLPDDFKTLNLPFLDARAWFKSAKGVSAASLSDITPIAPIVKLNKDDPRFIEPYSVETTINEGYNLALMDWQDFENLIRELFEKEFGSNGGEVKITQASRDGGVDAIAFDPDPIRGGKIVIQAKRYTNTVGVSAVRDLFGTIMNEGANKGILVTTSDYGTDAYNFAKGKPITLINGGHLLYLLEKHGKKARIDLKEAKELARDN